MRYRFFLSYAPLMIIIGFLSIWVTKQYGGKAKVSGYRAGNYMIGRYDGEHIKENENDKALVQLNKQTYNGSKLKDNGLPYCLKVNKKTNVVTVYKLDKQKYYTVPVKAMICSVGEKGNTPEGIFPLGDRAKWLPLEGRVYGQYAVGITESFLFHSVPYYSEDKGDIEVDEYNKLGSSASAGCVRLLVKDAKWIYDNCKENTLVEIFESDYEGPLGKPAFTPIAEKGKGDNWDPTDTDRDNPYMKEEPMILGACDRVIERYSDFDIAAGVTAIDSEGKDITKYMKVEGQVDGTVCGTYPVTFKVKDENGRRAAATINLTIKDEESPVLVVDQKVFSFNATDAGSAKQIIDRLRENVTAYDSGAMMPESAILVDYSEMTKIKYGKCHVKYRAKDSEGNVSDIVVLDIEVDFEEPHISLKDEFQKNIKIEDMIDDNYLIGLVDAEDNSGQVDVTLSRPLSYRIDEPYVVMYYAKDPLGNISTISVAYQLR